MRIATRAIATGRMQGFDGAAWVNVKVDSTGCLSANIGGLSTLAYGQAAMTDEEDTISGANADRRSLCIKNIGTEDVAIGGSGVTFTTGFILKPGEALSDIKTTTDINGICDTGKTTTVCAWEE